MKSALRPTTIIAVAVSALAVCVACVFIFCMSAQPAVDSDVTSLELVDKVIRYVVPGYDALSLDEQLALRSELNHPIRKIAHFSEYAVLGILMCNLVMQLARATSRTLCAGECAGMEAAGNALVSRWSRAAWGFWSSSCMKERRRGAFVLAVIAWACSTLYAVTDEIHQIFVPGRACQLSDICLDSAGALFGVALAIGVYCVFRHFSKRT